MFLIPVGISLPGTELLLTPVRTELSIFSLSRSYRRFLRSYRWSLRRLVASRSPMRRCRSLRDSLNIIKHREPLVKHYETLLKHCETSQNSRTLAIWCDYIGAWCGDIGARRGDIGARAEFPAISARSFRRYRHGVSGNIGDCGVVLTPQMCNRVNNHGDVSTFSKQVLNE